MTPDFIEGLSIGFGIGVAFFFTAMALNGTRSFCHRCHRSIFWRAVVVRDEKSGGEFGDEWNTYHRKCYMIAHGKEKVPT